MEVGAGDGAKETIQENIYTIFADATGHHQEDPTGGGTCRNLITGPVIGHHLARAKEGARQKGVVIPDPRLMIAFGLPIATAALSIPFVHKEKVSWHDFNILRTFLYNLL